MMRRAATASAACVLLAAAALGAATLWLADPATSTLEFSAEQAGARFVGRFARFTPRIEFDPAAPVAGRFAVEVDLASVDSGDRERDEALRGADFFDVARWPEARYVSTRIVARGDGEYEAQGRLTIRDRTREVPLRFRFTRAADGSALLAGRASLRRLEFGIGAEGDWRDTRWVGDQVEVRFELRLRGPG
jgi:polyisoprenoid-binding protein YceI